MAEFEVEDLRSIMDRKPNIRNICSIAHLDDGESTLTDSLMASAGIIAHETAADEAQDGITSLYYQYEMTDEDCKVYEEKHNGNDYLINIISLGRQEDFSSPALRITDGAIVTVDCMEGVSAHTETLVRKALCEGVHLVLIVNMDKVFLDEDDGDTVYKNIKSVIEKVNKLIDTYNEPRNKLDINVCPNKGNVAFSAHGWAFTMPSYAKKYADKCNVSESETMKCLWGDHFFDLDTNKWTKEQTENCERGFVRLCYKHIRGIIQSCMKGETVDLLTSGTMKLEEKELMGEPLMKRVMQNWLPASPALLEMIILGLPSPSTAQQYRHKNLYTAPKMDVHRRAIKKCNPDGQLMLYVSKMLPHKDGFFAFGRVFAGTVSTHMEVRIMGPNFAHGGMKDLYRGTVKRTLICMGKKQMMVQDVPCGNVVAIVVCLDKFIETATLTDMEAINAHPIRTMNFSFSPVVRIQVDCMIISHLPKLIEGLEELAKSDPRVVHIEEPDAHFIAGATEIHIYAFLEKLKKYFLGCGPLKISDPVVSFRETVRETSSPIVMESPNKQNKVFMKARPIGDKLIMAIEKKQIGPLDYTTGASLVEEFECNKDIAGAIWKYGPDANGPNVIVNLCKKDLSPPIKKSVEKSFQLASKEGALAGENMWGVCFELQDFLCADFQFNRIAKDAIHASQLKANPILLEPVYLVEIESHQDALDAVHRVLDQRRGDTIEEKHRTSTSLYFITAYLPICESIGFTSDLRAATSGKAWSECAFDHWAIVDGDPLDASSVAGSRVASIRNRKGLISLKASLDLLSK